jgi:hypothetical protein
VVSLVNKLTNISVWQGNQELPRNFAQFSDVESIIYQELLRLIFRFKMLLITIYMSQAYAKSQGHLTDVFRKIDGPQWVSVLSGR